MKPLEIPILARSQAIALDEFAAPSWVEELIASAQESRVSVDGVELRLSSTPTLSLVSARVRDAIDFSADAFELAVVKAYHQLHRLLATSAAGEPVRFWNHLPDIHQAMDDDRDRYMVFNAGRFKALVDWFGGADQLAGRIATASGVGHRGSDLIVHALALPTRGKAVENPRQIPAFRYSKKYGPLPPCFARATLIDALTPGQSGTPRRPGSPRKTLLVGGTASICGERSVHRDQLACQVRQTLANLSSLVHAAEASVSLRDALKTFDLVRVYHPRARDARAIHQYTRSAFTRARQIDIVQADLCRADLLIEIEGVCSIQKAEG